MLLGFSHIGFTVPSMNEAIEFFKALGFALEFANEGLRNAPEKKEFLNACPEKHDIAFLKGNINSVGVELIHYPLCAEKNFSPAFDVIIRGRAEVVGTHPSPVGPILILPDESKSAIDAITVKSRGLEASKKFWRDAVGFIIVTETGDALDFRPAISIPNWHLTLRVIRSDNAEADPCKLDIPGANLISLVTTSLEADKAKLKSGGGKNPSPIFSLVVNGRTLKICLLYSPEGRVVELIEFQKEGDKR
jgi:catechol 2,3-dioxygenase-like lactoylglutathione lyase family enzyme